jgi:hypothetical protein
MSLPDNLPLDGIAALWQRAMKILKEQMSPDDFAKISTTLKPVLKAAGADPASLAADSMTRAEKFHRAFPVAARLR